MAPPLSAQIFIQIRRGGAREKGFGQRQIMWETQERLFCQCFRAFQFKGGFRSHAGSGSHDKCMFDHLHVSGLVCKLLVTLETKDYKL